MAFKKFSDKDKKEWAKKKDEKFKKHMDEVRQLFITEAEKGNAPWQKPWKTTPLINFTNKSHYQGHNILLLALFGQYEALRQNRPFDPRFCTPKAAYKNGWKFDKENGTEYQVYYSAPKLVPLNDAEIDKIKVDEHKTWLEKDDELIPAKVIFINKHHTLYNIADLSGDNLPTLEETYGIAENGHQEWNKGELIEEMIDKLNVTLHVGGDRAFYAPFNDSITMPPKSVFESEEAYYGTLLHELCHWTGHHSRLNREINYKGTKKYAKEEVVAEMSSYALSTFFGVRDIRSEEERTESLTYTQSWLRSFDEEEKLKAFDDASKEANRIFTFLTKPLDLKQKLEEKDEQSEDDGYRMAM